MGADKFMNNKLIMLKPENCEISTPGNFTSMAETNLRTTVTELSERKELDLILITRLTALLLS